MYLKNVQWENTEKPLILSGYSSSNLVEDITFDNCRVGSRLLTRTADAMFQVNQYVKNIQFVNTSTAITVPYPAENHPAAADRKTGHSNPVVSLSDIQQWRQNGKMRIFDLSGRQINTREAQHNGVYLLLAAPQQRTERIIVLEK